MIDRKGKKNIVGIFYGESKLNLSDLISISSRRYCRDDYDEEIYSIY